MNQDENNPCSHGAYTQRVKLFFWVQEGCRVREMRNDKPRFPFRGCVHAGRACHPERYAGTALLEGLVLRK